MEALPFSMYGRPSGRPGAAESAESRQALNGSVRLGDQLDYLIIRTSR